MTHTTHKRKRTLIANRTTRKPSERAGSIWRESPLCGQTGLVGLTPNDYQVNCVKCLGVLNAAP